MKFYFKIFRPQENFRISQLKAGKKILSLIVVSSLLVLSKHRIYQNFLNIPRKPV